jgi:RNA recognition motif-containing protein
VQEEELSEFCRGYGKLNSIRIRSSLRDVFAFITFADRKLGLEGIRELDQKVWNGKISGDDTHVIQVREPRRNFEVRESQTSRPRRDAIRYRTPSRHRAQNAGHFRLDVKNLPVDMKWNELKDIARDLGQSITFTNVFIKSGVHCGVIEYKSFDDAKHALKQLHGRKMEGHDVKLEVTKKWE